MEHGCKFDMGWGGRCNRPVKEAGYCDYHLGIRCPCGEQATHTCCIEIMSQCMCGVKVCDKCDNKPCRLNHERYGP